MKKAPSCLEAFFWLNFLAEVLASMHHWICFHWLAQDHQDDCGSEANRGECHHTVSPSG